MSKTALQRKTPLKRGGPLKRSGPLKRNTRLRPVNSKRRARLYEKNFGSKADWIRSLPCATCNAPAPSDPSHVKSRGAGGASADLIPQCRPCHDELHRGCQTFEEERGVDLTALAAKYEVLWRRLELEYG